VRLNRSQTQPAALVAESIVKQDPTSQRHNWIFYLYTLDEWDEWCGALVTLSWK